MATYNKFNSFVEALAEKVHNLGSDQIVVALTNTLPLATNTQLSNITQISYTGLSTRNVVTVSSSQTSGTYSLILTDLTLTSSGTVGPFRYAVLYNDTATNDELIGWAEYPSGSITLNSGETLLIDFNPAGDITIV
jgi:hypothetical protein